MLKTFVLMFIAKGYSLF